MNRAQKNLFEAKKSHLYIEPTNMNEDRSQYLKEQMTWAHDDGSTSMVIFLILTR